ncbi:MAG: hypothetical protein Q7S64_01405 [bacterium]|nr:hypothetical protein [bacterium]
MDSGFIELHRRSLRPQTGSPQADTAFDAIELMKLLTDAGLVSLMYSQLKAHGYEQVELLSLAEHTITPFGEAGHTPFVWESLYPRIQMMRLLWWMPHEDCTGPGLHIPPDALIDQLYLPGDQHAPQLAENDDHLEATVLAWYRLGQPEREFEDTIDQLRQVIGKSRVKVNRDQIVDRIMSNERQPRPSQVTSGECRLVGMTCRRSLHWERLRLPLDRLQGHELLNNDRWQERAAGLGVLNLFAHAFWLARLYDEHVMKLWLLGCVRRVWTVSLTAGPADYEFAPLVWFDWDNFCLHITWQEINEETLTQGWLVENQVAIPEILAIGDGNQSLSEIP